MKCALALLIAAAVAPGDAGFTLRTRARTGSGVVRKTVEWDPAKTAVIVCDMWDTHNCKSAARRVGEMVPRFNRFVAAARRKGAFVIHAPSDTTNKFYNDHPGRRLAREAPAAGPPEPIRGRKHDPAREGPMPVDDSAWSCDDVPQCAIQKIWPWTRQHPDLVIADGDAVTSDGQEIFNLLRARGITNVLMTGVHTNYCVVGRPFGIRQLTMLGFHVVLVRDLTDSLYNPRTRPFVTHERGTELIVEHIERHWCPTALSSDLVGDALPEADFVPLFSGRDLSGWEPVGDGAAWAVEEGLLVCKGGKGGWLSTRELYGDFELALDYRVPPDGNSGVFLRAPREGNPWVTGMEIQILDDDSPKHQDIKPAQHTGSIYAAVPPLKSAARKAGEWNEMRIVARDTLVAVFLNGEKVVDVFLDAVPELKSRPRRGHLGLQNHGSRLEFRNLRVRRLD